jgi:selenocysteine lyase/cysteine desulfurase
MDKRALRDLFPVTRNVIYFNHAAVGPLSARACDAMERHARDQRDFGAMHWREWYAEYEYLRQAAARLIGAEASEIAILKNTSEGLSFVAEGLRWKAGDNVVTTGLEFPSNWTPWKRLESRGVECRVAPLPTVNDIEPLIDSRTRVVTVSSVAFHNGFAADLDAIGALCASRNVLFCVDAIQSVGVLPIDVRRAHIAFLACDGHKWMCGPEGAALFYVAAEHREELEVVESGWTNIDRKGKFIGCSTDLLPDARRFEAGSLNTNGIYGLHAAIGLLLEIGIDEISAEVLRLSARLAEGLESIGFCVGQAPSPVDPGEDIGEDRRGRLSYTIRSGIVGATPPNVETGILRLHRLLDEEKIITAPREGLLRFSPHFYNDDGEIDRVVEVLRRII